MKGACWRSAHTTTAMVDKFLCVLGASLRARGGRPLVCMLSMSRTPSRRAKKLETLGYICRIMLKSSPCVRVEKEATNKRSQSLNNRQVCVSARACVHLKRAGTSSQICFFHSNLKVDKPYIHHQSDGAVTKSKLTGIVYLATAWRHTEKRIHRSARLRTTG